MNMALPDMTQGTTSGRNKSGYITGDTPVQEPVLPVLQKVTHPVSSTADAPNKTVLPMEISPGLHKILQTPEPTKQKGAK